jgi:hypothetical protein
MLILPAFSANPRRSQQPYHKAASNPARKLFSPQTAVRLRDHIEQIKLGFDATFQAWYGVKKRNYRGWPHVDASTVGIGIVVITGAQVRTRRKRTY